MTSLNDEKIANLTLRHKFQQAATALVALTSLYIVNNMDTGDYFDLHKNVPQVAAQAAKEHPEANPVVLAADVNDAASKMENAILFMIAAINLKFGLDMTRLGLELKNAQHPKNTPS